MFKYLIKVHMTDNNNDFFAFCAKKNEENKQVHILF